MKISVKGRYALATMIHMATKYKKGEYITVISISESLAISKIYLEQVFSLLKRSNLLISLKGAQGGYQFARMPEQISVFDILSATEFSLFEKTEATVAEKAPAIEAAMQSLTFDILDKQVKDMLKQIKLTDFVSLVNEAQTNGEYMYYI